MRTRARLRYGFTFTLFASIPSLAGSDPKQGSPEAGMSSTTTEVTEDGQLRITHSAPGGAPSDITVDKLIDGTFCVSTSEGTSIQCRRFRYIARGADYKYMKFTGGVEVRRAARDNATIIKADEVTCILTGKDLQVLSALDQRKQR